jgi:hypothetical protein
MFIKILVKSFIFTVHFWKLKLILTILRDTAIADRIVASFDLLWQSLTETNFLVDLIR